MPAGLEYYVGLAVENRAHLPCRQVIVTGHADMPWRRVAEGPWCPTYARRLEPTNQFFRGTGIGMHEELIVLDLDDGRPSVDKFVLCLALDLGRHLEQHFNLVADIQCTWPARKEAFGRSRGADQLTSLQHSPRGLQCRHISRSKLVQSSAQNSRRARGLQAVIQEIDLMEPLLQSCAALV